MKGGRVGGVEVKRAELEGENHRGLSRRVRCKGGGVGGVKARGWSRRGGNSIKNLNYNIKSVHVGGPVVGVEAEGGGGGGGGE
jgi:hypothetical protein